MSAIGDMLISLGQNLPATLRKRKEEADAQARQDALDKAQRDKDALAAQVTNAQLGEITRKNTAEDAATARSTAAQSAVGDTLSSISSGDYRNPDTQIADPELEKEKAITANYGGILNAVNNRVGPPQPGVSDTAANKSLIDTVGLAGLGKMKTDIQNRQPADYFRAQTGAYSDQPVQKEVMSDFEKQAEMKQKADETAAENEKNRQAKHEDFQMLDQTRRDIATQNATNEANKQQNALAAKGTTSHDKDWADIQKQAMLQGRGINKAAQTAQQTLVNANRALMLLNKSVQTSQDASTIAADFNQIFAGHSATDMGMKEQTYQTIKSKIANAQQFWSGKPQSALPDDIKAHLVNVLGDLKNQNVGILKDYLDELETGRSTVIGAGAPHENDWQQLRGKVLNGGYVPGATSGGGAATSSGNRFTWQ
jgi:hypothetical protein